MNATCLAETADCEGCLEPFDRTELVDGAERVLCPECRGEDCDSEEDDFGEEDDPQGEANYECSKCVGQFEAEAGPGCTICVACLEKLQEAA